MRSYSLASFLVLGVAAFAIGCDDDDDEPTGPLPETFEATLTGAAERPDPRTTPAQGTADFTLSGDTLYWTITMTSITNVTAAHIHIGAADVAGGILLPLTPPVSNTSITGLIAEEDFTAPGPPNDAVTFDSMIALMRTGGVYVNVHTNDTSNDPTNNTGPGDFPAGEIRGQIARVP